MATSTAASLGPRRGPLSIEDIAKDAGNFEYNADVPLRYWMRTADAIQKQAQSYERDGNEQDAYLFYLRHSLLVMEKLTSHPQVKLPENQIAWKKMLGDLSGNMRKLELLNPTVKKRYDQYQQMVTKRKTERVKWTHEQQKNVGDDHMVDELALLSLGSGGAHSAQTGYGKRQELEPGENRELAVNLAHRELRNRGYMPSAQRSSGTSKLRPRKSSARSPRSDGSDDDDLSKHIIAVGSRGQQAFPSTTNSQSSRPPQSRTASGHRAPQYPSVPKKSIHNDSSYYGGHALPANRQEHHASSSTIPPSRPPKEYFQDNFHAPPVPEKIETPSPPPHILEAPDTGLVELDSRDYSFKPSALTENGGTLRTVFINPKLRNQFLTIALTNTERNLETCGILCGTLISNAFFISKLVIPEQESTSDTCDTVNEGALFDYCDSENLMTLGWIHTHPTQTCFMSSRDLHTHGGYQVQLAESIAIVCAPKHNPSWGVFRLTDPPGLKTILSCRQTGLFHPHGEINVYTDALKPGHVCELPGMPFDVVDLRPGSSWL